MKRYITALVFLFASMNSFAGDWVVYDAHVTLIQSTTGTQNAYWIWYETNGPTDTCNGKIKFVPSNGSQHVDPETFRRGFDLATLAMVHGLTINIWQYAETLDCANSVANVELRRFD